MNETATNLHETATKLHETATKPQQSQKVKLIVTKRDLADHYGVSARTLSLWLNRDIYEKLIAVGYRKTAKVLNRKILRVIFAEYGTIENE